MGTTHVTVTI